MSQKQPSDTFEHYRFLSRIKAISSVFFRNKIKNIIPVSILLIGIILSGLIAYYAHSVGQRDLIANFEYHSQEISDRIEQRMSAYETVLRGAAGLFNASNNVTREDFKSYVATLHLADYYPGIQGVGFSLKVLPEDSAANVARIRNSGFPGFTMFPEGKRDYYTSIIYLEPFRDRNLRAFGYDMWSENIRREAMALACDSGRVQISGKIKLVQETNKNVQAGFLMYIPVYKFREVPNTVKSRRENLIGWTYAPFRVDDFMAALLAEYSAEFDIKIYDSTDSDPKYLMSGISNSKGNNYLDFSFQSKNTLRLGNHDWVVVITATQNYASQRNYSNSGILFALGLMISFSIFFVLLVFIKKNEIVLAESAKVETLYKALLHKTDYAVLLINSFREIKEVNEIALQYFGYSKEEFLNKKIEELHSKESIVSALLNLNQLQASGALKYEIAHQRKDGSEFICHVNASIIKYLGADYILSIISDISERNKAEEELKQTRENFETFFNTVDDLLFVLDLNGNILHINNAVKNRLKYTKEELLGKSVLSVHPEARRAEAHQIVGEMLAGTKDHCPVPVLTKDGIEIPVETRISHGFWNGAPAIFGVTKDISAIQLSEEKFSKVFYVNPLACGLSDLSTGEYVEVNDAFYNLFGFSTDEVIGHTSIELGIIPSKTRESINAYMGSNPKLKNFEATLYTKTGEERHVLLSADEINFQGKKYRYTVVNDFTEKKIIEDELRWSESFLKLMTNTSPLGFLVVDNRTDEVIYFNHRFCEIWGITDLEERIKRRELKNSDLMPYYRSALVEPETFISSCTLLHDEANRTIVDDDISFLNDRSVHRYSSQMRGPEDEYYGRFCIFEEVTDRKRLEDALRQSVKQMEAIISASPDGIGILTLDGTIVLASDKLLALYGYTPSERDLVIGRVAFEFIDESEHLDLFDNFSKLVNGERESHISELLALNRKMERFYVEVNSSVLRDSDGKPTHVIFVERDITERKVAEEEIKKINEQLVKINSDKDRFFSIIAHDLRSPFHGFLGLTELLASLDAEMPLDKVQKMGKSMHQSATNLFNLLKNLLEWSQMQRGTMNYNPMPFTLNHLIADSIENMTNRSNAKNITIISELKDSITVFADEKMVASVILNILSNAVKFSNSGDTIIINAITSDEDLITISITDSGVGIPKETIPLLFSLGEKIGTKGTAGEPSTGLGLLLCKEFVEKNGGTIWVESEPGKGSRFSFTLKTL